MTATATKSHDPCSGEGLTSGESIMKFVEVGTGAADVTLRSGRRFELQSGATVDTLTVRSASGCVLLRVTVGDNGPLLSFDSADITLSARHRLTLSAPEVAISARELQVHAGSSEHIVDGHRHTVVRGQERLEASSVEIQANERDIRIRAMQHIALDGEHIGLNDDPCPAPFPWSAAQEDSSK